jgi:hypothetical protein
VDKVFINPQDPRQGLLVFAFMWVGISVAIAFASGWRQLARRFATARPPEGDLFRFVSGSFSSNGWFFPTGYGNCLTVAASAAGLRISVLFLLRIMHPPLLIPWSAIESVVLQEQFWFRHRTTIRIRDFDRRLSLNGKAGERIAAMFAGMKAATSGPGPVAVAGNR